MKNNKTKNPRSRRVVAGVAIAAAAFTGVGALPIVAPDVVAQAQAAESGIWKYQVVDDHVELTGLTYEGSQKLKDNGGKLPDFPLEIEGKKVLSIISLAFSKDLIYNNQPITSIPESWGNITKIGADIFKGHQITNLPDWETYKPLQDSKKNPGISSAARCTTKPLNVALIFDTSDSIKEEGIEKYKESTSDFIDNVSDKGVSIASFDFAFRAFLSKPEPLLVTKDSKEKVKASINEHFKLKGSTNWESGLINARDNNTVNNGKPRYDLVVFISDGFPTGKVTDEDITNMQAAQKVANQLKEQGSKVISMGVGPELAKDQIRGLSNLLPLSGPRENNDYYLGDWDELASMLTHTTQNVTCGTQVDARAQIIDKDGKTTDSAAQGFEFSAEVTQTKHDNVTVVGESKKTTPNALWSFPFNFNDKTGDDLRQSTADITITQKPKDGFTFLNGEYKIVNNEDGKVIKTGSLTNNSTVIKDVPADAHVQVVAKYHDSSITPDVEQAEKHNPGYIPAETTPSTAVDIEQTGDKELPDGTKFGEPEDIPDGWEVKVDEKTGKVTATPPKDAKPGDKGEFTVPVTYPDGSKDEAPVTVTVKDNGDGDGSGDGDNTGGNDGDNTPGDNTGDGGKDNGSGDGDKGDGDNTGNTGDNTGGNDGNNTPGDGDNTGGNNTGDNTKKPDFSGLPGDNKDKDTSKSPTDDSNDKDKPSGSKVVDNGNKGATDGNNNASNGGVKGGFKPVTPANPSRVNQAPSAPSGFAPITGPGVGTVLAGGSGAGKGAVVDTGGAVQESFWTKIANLFR